jgi:NAD(P)-dependent dehydrogenase (short-subunit alcohol dehydrogenase family)
MQTRLKDETAIVTGTAGGIGRATALRLARDGARVLAVDVQQAGLDQTAALAATESLELVTLVADVADDRSPKRIVDHAVAAFGSLRLLVNNAGIGGSHRAEETPDEEFDRFLSVNLRSVFRMSRAAVARMRPSGGSIVNVASIYGMTGFPGSSGYAASKAGVIGLTRQMAADYGPFGIRVNAVSPGLIDTAMTRARIAGSAWFRSMMTEMTPLQRNGKPEDVAAAVAFLCSSDAAFISAQVLTVDGGWLATRYRAGLDNLPASRPPA